MPVEAVLEALAGLELDALRDVSRQQPLKREAVLPSAAVLGVLDLVRVRVWVGARRVSYDLPPGPKLPPGP